jgi:hypothetical protein
MELTLFSVLFLRAVRGFRDGRTLDGVNLS